MLVFGISNWNTVRDTNISLLLRWCKRYICTTIKHTSLTWHGISDKPYWYAPLVRCIRQRSRGTVYENCVQAMLMLLYVHIIIFSVKWNGCQTVRSGHNFSALICLSITVLWLWSELGDLPLPRTDSCHKGPLLFQSHAFMAWIVFG